MSNHSTYCEVSDRQVPSESDRTNVLVQNLVGISKVGRDGTTGRDSPFRPSLGYPATI